MNYTLVIGNNYTYDELDFKNRYVIGVDKGALFCLNNKIKMDYAIGDFDSISKVDLEKIKQICPCKILNPIKDKTDTLEAIELASKDSDILIVGAISGKRVEHFYANLLLLKNYPNIHLKDNNSYIFTSNKNVKLDNKYKYVSIFSIEKESIISLSGFKYNLDRYNLLENDPLCISNEVINLANISIHSGRIMIILSENDNEGIL